MDGIERRIAKLERENRFLKVAGTVGAVAVVCAVLMGVGPAPEQPGVVTAREFHLVRADGTDAGYWSISPKNGLAHLIMESPLAGDNGMIAALGFLGDGEQPYLMLHGKGTPGATVQLGAKTNGESFVDLYDQGGHRERARVFVTPDGEGKILLRRDAKTESWRSP